jgi:hypothetical protein
MDMDDPTDENGYCPVCGPRHFFLSGEWFHTPDGHQLYGRRIAQAFAELFGG